MSGEGGADGGVDIVLSRGSDRYFVQCEQWKARQVRVTTVRELYGVMAAQGAAGGYVVTSGVFTDEARRFAERREIELLGGDQLVEIIGAQTKVMGSGHLRLAEQRALVMPRQNWIPVVTRMTRHLWWAMPTLRAWTPDRSPG